MPQFPPSLMSQYLRDPRLAMALRAQQTGASTAPVASPIGGLARALQGLVGGYSQSRLRGEYQDRSNAYQKTLAEALGTGNTVPVGSDTQETGGFTGNRMSRIAQILSQNPDTAGLATEVGLKDALMGAQFDRRTQAAREKSRYAAPKTRSYKKDGMEVTEQWNPQSLKWEQVGASGIGVVSPDAVAQKAQIAGAGKAETNINVGLSKGQTEADKKAATDYNKFVLQGGAADMQKNIAQLKEVQKALQTSDNLTGPLIGMMPKSVRAAINPESVNTQELVEEVVQRNLREVLGAQFTEKEGERLISRAYNPLLDEKTNAERLGRLLGAIEKTFAAKIAAAEYFEENGTLKGFKGTTQFTVSDIEREAGLTETKPPESGWSIQKVP